MLERSVVEKCCREVMEKSVVEKCCGFMYLFMGVLWGHFSSSNSRGILAQELDIHICVDEIFFLGCYLAFMLSLQTVT